VDNATVRDVLALDEDLSVNTGVMVRRSVRSVAVPCWVLMLALCPPAIADEDPNGRDFFELNGRERRRRKTKNGRRMEESVGSLRIKK